MKDGRHTAWMAAWLVPVAAVALLHLGFVLNRGVNVYDEGLAVYGAARVLDGEVPYRDFWTLYAPGQFYALAFLFRVFGPSLVVERAYGAALLLAIGALTFRLVRRAGAGRPAAWAAWCLVTVWLSSYRFYASPVLPALASCLLSWLAVLSFSAAGRMRSLVLAGAWSALALLFRQDLGGYAVIAAWLWLGLRARRSAWRPLGAHAAGVAAVLVPAAGWFALRVPVDAAFRDLVVFPLRVFPRVRALPYPALSLAGVGFYFPILVFAVGAASVFRGIRRGATAVRGTGFAALLPVLLWGVLSLLHVRVRSDEAHLLAPLVPAVVLFVLLVGRTGSSGCPHPVWRGALVIVAALTFLKPVTGQVMFLLSARERTGGYCLRVSRARGIRMPEGGALYDALARYVHARVPRGREIFVGNLRHDRIAINDVLLYFLSGRDSATHYHELHPGVATTGPVQERIVRELEEAEVPLIVLGPFDNTEPSLGGQSSGVRRLDRYLRERFRPEARFGTYEVWTRREF